MPEPDPKITELEDRLDNLVRTQIDFQKEISFIRTELQKLRSADSPAPESVPPKRPAERPKYTNTAPPPRSAVSDDSARSRSTTASQSGFSNYVENARADLEKFIGEDLISKVGIIVLVLGVGIGAKYAIDNDLISPFTRIVIGYVFGIGLIGLAVKLKPKYHNFSAVLLSGGMAIMYFVTYFAYSSYELISLLSAFALMMMFTVFTVAAALLYRRQVIALIGLVGAYAVPFLLSDDSGNYLFLFAYIAIINTGILAISITKSWKTLIYTSFVFTWLIYGTWYFDRYEAAEHLYLAAVFTGIFFAIFYFSVIAHRLIANNFSLVEHATLVLSNSFIFYGFGCSIMDGNESMRNFLGLYTAAHAALHLAVAHLVSKLRSSVDDVVQVLTILVLTFASIAIPVQFDGNFVTLIWSAEAAMLFWFGRTKGIRLFEYFSFPVMALAMGSMFLDWAQLYWERSTHLSEHVRQPIANGDLVTALVLVVAFAFIFITNRDDQYEPAIDANLVRPFGAVAAGIALFVLYNAFRIEIGNYYHVQAMPLYASYEFENPAQVLAELRRFNVIWQLNYSLFFLIAMAAVNLRKFRSTSLAAANTAFGILFLLIFVTAGMTLFHELRVSYMLSGGGSMNIAIRYISYTFAAGLIFALFAYSRDELLTKWLSRDVLRLGFDAVAYTFVFICASGELVNLMGQFHIADATKLGLSILWGVYALALIVIGIAQNKKHIRISAIVLLAVTLAKLFFYDIANLDTIPKTILFVTLGITLLAISFLYNKYKSLIFKAEAGQEE